MKTILFILIIKIILFIVYRIVIVKLSKSTPSTSGLPIPSLIPILTYESAHKNLEDSAYVAEAYSK